MFTPKSYNLAVTQRSVAPVSDVADTERNEASAQPQSAAQPSLDAQLEKAVAKLHPVQNTLLCILGCHAFVIPAAAAAYAAFNDFSLGTLGKVACSLACVLVAIGLALYKYILPHLGFNPALLGIPGLNDPTMRLARQTIRFQRAVSTRTAEALAGINSRSALHQPSIGYASDLLHELVEARRAAEATMAHHPVVMQYLHAAKLVSETTSPAEALEFAHAVMWQSRWADDERHGLKVRFGNVHPSTQAPSDSAPATDKDSGPITQVSR